MRLIACTLVVLLCAGPVLAQPSNVVFFDEFDSYGAGYLSIISDPVWTIDTCFDAKTDDDPATYMSDPYSLKQYKDGSTNTLIGVRNKHVFTAGELQLATSTEPNANAIGGGDGLDEALRVVYLHHCKIQTVDYSWENRFVEVVCGDDRAPTDMIHAVCDPGGANEKHRYHLANVSNDPDATGAPVHASIAIGMIALADMDPCSPTTKQTVYRVVVYDGQYWRILKDYPTTGINMHTCYKWNWLELNIKSTTIDVTVSNKYNETAGDCSGGGFSFTRTTTIPRKYLGDFTSIVMGGLVMEDWDLPPEEQDPQDPYRPVGNCWGNRQGGGVNNVASHIDNVYVYGGVAQNITEGLCDTGNPPPTGACCHEDTLTCEDGVEEATCRPSPESLNVWHEGADCVADAIVCCAEPFADADNDDDVDQVDFGIWQACFSGNGNDHPAGDTYPCACFNRDATGDPANGDVDGTDFIDFEACWSGPTVSALTSCDGGV